MKKNFLVFASLALFAGLWACNGNNDTTTTTTNQQSTDSTVANGNTNTTSAGTTSSGNNLPLTPADSTFVMKAAMGGMMEVEAGTIAQQNAQSERVKAFGSMMVKDHQSANQELMRFASGKGLTIPSALPADMQKHTTAIRNMKGKSFDSHYMDMMVNDHQKTIADFEKQAAGGGDPELKAWAAKTLPVLQMHRDSATAINQAIK